MYRSIIERACMKRQLLLCTLLLTISTGAFASEDKKEKTKDSSIQGQSSPGKKKKVKKRKAAEKKHPGDSMKPVTLMDSGKEGEKEGPGILLFLVRKNQNGARSYVH